VGIITHVDEAPALSGSNKTRFLAIGGVVLALLLATVGVVSLRGGARGLLYIEIPSDATAGVQVNINGTPIKEEDDTQLKPGPHLVPVAAGTLTVMVVADGYETVIETVEVKEGNEYTRLITKMKKK